MDEETIEIWGDCTYCGSECYVCADDIKELLRALSVLVVTPHIRAYLQENDPKALEQAEKALGPTGCKALGIEK